MLYVTPDIIVYDPCNFSQLDVGIPTSERWKTVGIHHFMLYDPQYFCYVIPVLLSVRLRCWVSNFRTLEKGVNPSIFVLRYLQKGLGLVTRPASLVTAQLDLNYSVAVIERNGDGFAL